MEEKDGVRDANYIEVHKKKQGGKVRDVWTSSGR